VVEAVEVINQTLLAHLVVLVVRVVVAMAVVHPLVPLLQEPLELSILVVAAVGVLMHQVPVKMAAQAALVLSSSNGHNLYQPLQHLIQMANGMPLRA
jgi:uncharacterized protein YhhL (DUF1145 family)